MCSITTSGHLDGDLSLARLSSVACFSPFHFHRVFQGATGETLNSHVRRVRLERAALLMRTSPRRRIRNHFNQTASSWDRRSPLEKSKICKAPETLSFHTEEELKRWKAVNRVRARLVPFNALRYVYTRIFSPYAGGRLLERHQALMAWLANRGTDPGDVVFIGMSLDDPSITPSEHCRYDLGVAFPLQGGEILGDILRSRGGRPRHRARLPEPGVCAGQELTMRDFTPGQAVSIHCVGDLGHEERAWHYLYRLWLPASGFLPADLPAMELFVRLPEEIGWQTFDLETCIPVVRF